jgi:diphthine-ammonia ligase
MKPKAMVSWSGGKDCYLALTRVREDFEIAGLLTMMTEDGQRSRSHGLRPELLQSQAKLLGLPHLTEPATWADYETAFGRLLARARTQGATHIIFGDIYPEANRIWAETVSAREGLTAVEPLWAESTEKLAHEFLSTQSTAIITTVRDAHLDQSYLGKTFSFQMVDIFLEKEIDPCGERGEFHTFVTHFGQLDGSIPVTTGPIHEVGGCSAIDLSLSTA